MATVDQELAELEAELAKEEKAEAERMKSARVKALKLRKEHSSLGKHGRDFMVVESSHGDEPIVIKRPSRIALERLNSAKEEEQEVIATDLIAQVLVHPEEGAFRARVATFAGTLAACILAIGRMHDTLGVERRGK